MVFYSDGLIESDRNIMRGLERLIAAIARPEIASSPNPAKALYHAVLKRGGSDDVVVLTLRLEPLPEVAVDEGDDETSSLRWAFETDNAGLAHATRHSFVKILRDAGVREKQLDAAETVFGELLGNVVRYAPGPIEIVFDWNHGRRRCSTCSTAGPGFAFTPKLPLGSAERARPRALHRVVARGRFQRDAAPRRRLARARGVGDYLAKPPSIACGHSLDSDDFTGRVLILGSMKFSSCAALTIVLPLVAGCSNATPMQSALPQTGHQRFDGHRRRSLARRLVDRAFQSRLLEWGDYGLYDRERQSDGDEDVYAGPRSRAGPCVGRAGEHLHDRYEAEGKTLQSMR